MTLVAWIATYAALVSTLSLVVAVLAFRAGAPRLRPSTQFLAGQAGRPAELQIVVENAGRAAGKVTRIDLDAGGHTIPLGREGDPALNGPTLGDPIEPHSTAIWWVAVSDLIEIMNRNGWPYDVRAVIVAGAQGTQYESIHRCTNLISG